MDFENMVSLSDFARERDVDKQVITVYINRHPEIKEHVHYDKYNRNTAYLDDEAVKLLSKKYRMTTQIITDNELYEQVITCNNKMQTMADMMMAMMVKMDERMTIGMQAIEEKQADNELLKRIEKLETENAKRIKELEAENEKLREEKETLRKDKEIEYLEAEKLRLERENMIGMNYLQLVHHLNKLKREKFGNNNQ